MLPFTVSTREARRLEQSLRESAEFIALCNETDEMLGHPERKRDPRGPWPQRVRPIGRGGGSSGSPYNAPAGTSWRLSQLCLHKADPKKRETISLKLYPAMPCLGVCPITIGGLVPARSRARENPCIRSASCFECPTGLHGLLCLRRGTVVFAILACPSRAMLCQA